MKKTSSRKLFIATFIGNIVEHYDKVLFGLIAPFIAPLFFPKSDPIVALILIYLPLGFIARPLGALYWGRIGDRFGRKRVLYFSILGMSLTILLTGLLPTYKTLGILSALLLHFKRALTCFFAAGEGTGASLILIENSKSKSKDLMSSFYEASSMVGVFIASILITFLCFKGKVLEYWRLLFIVSGILGLIGFWFRKEVFDIKKIQETSLKCSEPLFSIIRFNWFPFLAIISLTGFSCANYHVLTQMMNGYLPIVSSITHKEMMLTHTLLILYDALMLPLFGLISKKIGKEKLIIISLLIAISCIFPLFFLLNTPSTFKVLLIRISMVTWGIAIAAPFSYWTISLIAEKERFRTISLARAFGAQWIGGPAISLSLLLYKWTGWVFSPALYIFFSALISMAFVVILALQKKNVPLIPSSSEDLP